MAYSFHGDITVIHRIGKLFFTRRLASAGLGGWQTGYIEHICREPGISQDRLARRLFVNKSTVTRQLGILEEGGFLQRKNSPEDARVQRIYPTEKAQAALPLIRQAREEWKTYLTQALSPEECEAVSVILDKMRSRAEGFARTDEREGEKG